MDPKTTLYVFCIVMLLVGLCNAKKAKPNRKDDEDDDDDDDGDDVYDNGEKSVNVYKMELTCLVHLTRDLQTWPPKPSKELPQWYAEVEAIADSCEKKAGLKDSCEHKDKVKNYLECMRNGAKKVKNDVAKKSFKTYNGCLKKFLTYQDEKEGRYGSKSLLRSLRQNFHSLRSKYRFYDY
ncbi:uncharacterized protein LOC135388863 [Ornithodoros turicata]|uniref:uncharacterized protein LOC135388863 n=1 Tax=Ornithodoros turicata TaxID=34597 RepID=UPI0031394E7B